MLADRARGDGLKLTGGGGPLHQLTKRVLKSALDGEITGHVGYDKHDPAVRGSGNIRNRSSMNGPDRDYYQRKRAEGRKHQQALNALARRRVDVLWALLRDNRCFQLQPPAHQHRARSRR